MHLAGVCDGLQGDVLLDDRVPVSGHAVALHPQPGQFPGGQSRAYDLRIGISLQENADASVFVRLHMGDEDVVQGSPPSISSISGRERSACWTVPVANRIDGSVANRYWWIVKSIRGCIGRTGTVSRIWVSSSHISLFPSEKALPTLSPILKYPCDTVS